MIYKFNKFSIEIWRDIESEKDDVEFYVFFNGEKYFGWAFTINAIRKCMEKDEKTGESCNGIYFWAAGLVIVKSISLENLEKTISDIIDSNPNSLNDIFCKVDFDCPG